MGPVLLRDSKDVHKHPETQSKAPLCKRNPNGSMGYLGTLFSNELPIYSGTHDIKRAQYTLRINNILETRCPRNGWQPTQERKQIALLLHAHRPTKPPISLRLRESCTAKEVGIIKENRSLNLLRRIIPYISAEYHIMRGINMARTINMMWRKEIW